MNPSLHEILGLPSNARAGDIEQAVRTFARANHPDSVGSEAFLAKFQVFSEAYALFKKECNQGKDPELEHLWRQMRETAVGLGYTLGGPLGAVSGAAVITCARGWHEMVRDTIEASMNIFVMYTRPLNHGDSTKGPEDTHRLSLR